MHSAAPRKRLRLQRIACIQSVIFALAVAGVFAGPAPLAGQTAAPDSTSDAQPAWASAATPPAPWLAPSVALPPILTPPAVGTDELVAFQEGGNGPLPYLFGIFGGIAGMFVGDWWADRNCGDSCGQTNIPMLFLGGGLGAIIGYLIGGGELPDDSPQGRWP
jgi:hypothetical protein